jgi:hypothetical protein
MHAREIVLQRDRALKRRKADIDCMQNVLDICDHALKHPPLCGKDTSTLLYVAHMRSSTASLCEIFSAVASVRDKAKGM